jgi:imidazolonepropionase-like amidohydrolase
LKLLQGIGLTPREALAAATSNIANAFRLADRGKLEAGRRADLVILTEDPRIDVAAVDAIFEVMVNGQFVDRAQSMQKAVARRHTAAKGG